MVNATGVGDGSGAVRDALADAVGLLRFDLYEHLDQAEALALRNDEWSEAQEDQGRTLIVDLVRVIRCMVIRHEEDPAGTCAQCGMAGPCVELASIRALVKDPDGEFVRLVRAGREAGC
jgi:hypothetical protein